MDKSSLDNLAHIANISEDLQALHEVSHLLAQNLRLHNVLPLLSELEQRKTRRIACTCCRQQKSRCDAQQKLPLPCTRCATKGLACEVKAGFKRTEKRARLALLEREYLELRKSFQGPNGAADILRTASNLPIASISGSPPPALPLMFSQQITTPRLGTPSSQSATVPDRLPIFNQYPPHGQLASKINSQNGSNDYFNGTNLVAPLTNVQLPKSYNELDSKVAPSVTIQKDAAQDLPKQVLYCDEKTLEDVTLSSQMIENLYLEYVNNYHPILPIVDITRGPERIYRLCPSLFWVIIYVTLRRFNDDKSLLLKISPLVKNILAEITISPIARYNPTEEEEPIMNSCSVYSVQAFVLYSMWPPLTSSLSADSSWSTIGVALNQAIRIGLHSSGQLLEQYKGVEQQASQYLMAQEQMKTWILCNTVSQNIASAFGYPAFVQLDFLSAQNCNLSVATRHLMEIAQFEDQVCKTLNLATFSGSSQNSERLALLKVLGNQLDDLELKVVTECSQENGFRKFQFILARVHLLSNYFLNVGNIPALELSKGLVRLYNASVSLIEHVQMSQAKNCRFVEYLPAVSVLSIWQASFFIVKLAHSPMKSIFDVVAARETFGVAVDLVAKASILKHDIAYRGSGIMKNVWQLFRTLDEQNLLDLRLTIKSRMAASVFFDCLSLLRDKVGLAKLNIKTDVRGNSESNDDDADSSEDEMSGHRTGEHVSFSDDENGSFNAQQSDKAGTAESQRTTPGSYGSSSRNRKKRTLSDTGDTESTARRIIRTIPLDPQPISATKRSSIFKVVNGSNQTSPNTGGTRIEDRSVASRTTPVIKIEDNESHSHEAKTDHQSHNIPNQMSSTNSSESIIPSSHILDSEQSVSRSVGPSFNIENLLEQNLFEDNDMLWKDVDSLMNDFGFHA